MVTVPTHGVGTGIGRGGALGTGRGGVNRTVVFNRPGLGEKKEKKDAQVEGKGGKEEGKAVEATA